MKKLLSRLAGFECPLLILCILAISISAFSAETEPGDIRVLLTYGGHNFEQKPFFEMFDKMPGVKYTRAPLPESAKLLKPGLEREYDVIVMYDMVKSFTDEQQAAFIDLLNTGIGVVSLHHNIGAHQEWEKFPKIIGGRYFINPQVYDGKEYGKSGFVHGETIKVTIADKRHPITKGVSDFVIHDETYNWLYVSDKAHVLLTTDHPKCTREISWTTNYGNSPVFYLMLGHDSKAWHNPVYPKLLINGIHWASSNIGGEGSELRAK